MLMNKLKRSVLQPTALWLAAAGLLVLPQASAQITNVVFSEDFSGTTVDSSKFAPDSPYFEGGSGDITATQHDGVVEFQGQVNQQWWAGATLRVIPTFEASPEKNLVVSVDRVQELGGTTGSRSALWIMDTTQSYYVLFADVNLEGGWHYNRKIGLGSDNPTGGGTNIGPFDGDPWDNLELHRMKVVANGSTVKLYLDDVFGAEVQFPFSNLLFHIGSYARANNDTAHTIFDNLKIETVGTATFSATALTLGLGQTSTGLIVRIPVGANATTAVTLRVVSSNPAIAIPVGATGDTLTLTFPAGGSNEQAIDVQSVATGAARLTLANDIGLAAGNALQVTVVPGPGVRLTDDFSAGTLDTAKWEINDAPFETGVGTFEVAQSGGTLNVSGTLDQTAYWDGASARTVGEFIATKDLSLSFEVDRVSVANEYMDLGPEYTASAVRTGVFITTADRSQFVFFGQDLGETGWQVNVNPGNPTGSGTAIAAFAGLASDKGNHRLKLVATGSEVEVFLDGVSGGRFPFAVTSGIRFEVGAYARDLLIPDYVKSAFDNVKVENSIPCVTVAPNDIVARQGDTTLKLTVTIPKLLNAVSTKVTITSSAPAVAVAEGAVNGVTTLTFPPGSTNVQTVKVVTTGTGTAHLTLANDQGACVGTGVNLTITPPPQVLMSDDFSGTSLDEAKWTIDSTPLEGGTLTADSAVTVADGQLKMNVICEVANWPGYTLWTKTTYDASDASPVLFQINRAKMEYVQAGGDATKVRTGIWVKDAAGHYVFFSDFGSFTSGAPRGWQFHRFIDQAGDVLIGTPDTSGTFITAYDGAAYADYKNHQMRAVANGSTVKLYLDDVLGTEVAFPFSTGLVFGIGSYANYANNFGNTVRGFWDDAVVQGFPPSSQLSIARSGGNVVITWTGSGTLQSADALGTTTTWTDVTPPPTGSTYTITPAAMGVQKFYRLR